MIKSINFEFVRTHNGTLADLGGFAEQYAHNDPAGAAVKIRIAVEECVVAIYQSKRLRPPLPHPHNNEPTLDQLIDGPDFTAVVPRTVRERLHAVRKIANKGAHRADGRVGIDTKVAIALLRDTFDVVAFTATFLRWVATAPAFVEVPPGGAAGESKGQLQREKREALQQKAELEFTLTQLAERDAARERALGELSRALEFTNEQLERLREEASRSADVLKLDEAHTRAWLIDVMIEDAGWDLADHARVGREVDLGSAGVADR
jgi:type I restriction enzyme, R subunit